MSRQRTIQPNADGTPTMPPIDPQEFGRMQGEVEDLKKAVYGNGFPALSVQISSLRSYLEGREAAKDDALKKLALDQQTIQAEQLVLQTQSSQRSKKLNVFMAVIAVFMFVIALLTLIGTMRNGKPSQLSSDPSISQSHQQKGINHDRATGRSGAPAAA